MKKLKKAKSHEEKEKEGADYFGKPLRNAAIIG